MCNPDSPFYLSINYKPGDGAHWYKKQKMGKDRIGQIMKRISTQGSLQGRKTNHSARKTMITKLAHCDVPDNLAPNYSHFGGSTILILYAHV